MSARSHRSSSSGRATWRAELGSLMLFFVLLLCSTSAGATSSTFSGLARVPSLGSVSLLAPKACAVGPDGTVYLADTSHARIVTLTPQGVAAPLTVSGVTLAGPRGLALDGAGNLYVADSAQVVRISASGVGSVISTAQSAAPQGIAVDPSGNLFVSFQNNALVEIPNGGSAAALSLSGVTSLGSPMGLAVDPAGNLYIADTGHARIVKVAAGGTAATVVSLSGSVTSLVTPQGVAVDRIGNLYIADGGLLRDGIVEVDASGDARMLPLVTGSGALAPALGTEGSGVLGVALDVLGNVWIADANNQRLLAVAPPIDPSVTPGSYYTLNKAVVNFGHVQMGAAAGTTLTLPITVGTTPVASCKVLNGGAAALDFTVLPAGTTLTNGDAGISRNIEVQFLPSTVPGLRSAAVVLLDGSANALLTIPLTGFADAPWAVLAPNTASVIDLGGLIADNPFQICMDGAGNLYVGNHVASQSNPKVIRIPAGGGSASGLSLNLGSFSPDSLGNWVTGVAVDAAGNLFIDDYSNGRIVVVTPAGATSILAVHGVALSEPSQLVFDAAGNLYIADNGLEKVVVVSGLVVAGNASSGQGTLLKTGTFTLGYNSAYGVAVDPSGTVYIADNYNNNSQIVKVTAAGAASLLAPPVGFTFIDPQGVYCDSFGTLYVSDHGNDRIVRMTSAGVYSAITGLGLSPLSPGTGIVTDPAGNLYIPDTGNNRLVFVGASAATLAFPSTFVGAASAAQTASVTNLGNQPLAFSTNPTYTANFSNAATDDNPVSSSTSLAPGSSADVSVQFTPQSAGSLSAGILLTNNTLNAAGSTQQVLVSGSASYSSSSYSVTFATDGSTGAALSGSISQTVSAGASTTAVTAVAPSGYGFVAWTGTGGLATSTSNPLTVTNVSADHAITAHFSAVPAYAVTFQTDGSTGATLTGTTTQNILSGHDAAAVTAVAPAGHVFVDWTGTGGFATTTSNPLTIQDVTAAQVITAHFAANAIVVTSPPDPVVTLPVAGGSATTSITLGAIGTVPNPVTLSASGLPAGAICTFSSNTIDLSAGPATIGVTITTAPSLRIIGQNPNHGHNPLGFGTGAFLACGVLASGRRRKRFGIFLSALLLVLVGGMTACSSRNGGSGATTTSATQPAAGTYVVVITASSKGVAEATTSFNLTLH